MGWTLSITKLLSGAGGFLWPSILHGTGNGRSFCCRVVVLKQHILCWFAYRMQSSVHNKSFSRSTLSLDHASGTINDRIGSIILNSQ
mmetsp:Transcript_29208/g.67714  ORF Transcript_29208/g.67714 Transcript_29208/m.67714 type:complete len:87 (-) Transcript_29208:428-688(-)